MEDSSLFQRLRYRLLAPPINHEYRFDTKLDAVDCFTSRVLSSIPAHWVSELLEFRGRANAMPMWGELFLVAEEHFARKIGKHLADCDFGEDSERQWLVDNGWQVVPTTGLFARWLDGELLLGIDGAGYDFFEAHWEPLFDLLGLKWHLDD